MISEGIASDCSMQLPYLSSLIFIGCFLQLKG